MPKRKILVPEAHAVGAVGVIRSLGQAGYEVHALSYRKDALGFSSIFADYNAISPPYKDPMFTNWFRSYVSTHNIDIIIPSDGLLLALRAVFREFQFMMALKLGEDDVYKAFSKYDVISLLLDKKHPPDVSINLPPTVPIDYSRCSPAKETFSSLLAPYFIKTDAVHALKNGDSLVEKIASISHLLDRLRELRKHYKKLIVQGFADGIDVGVYFLIWDGEVVAEFMNKSLHSVPHTGGFYSLRESWVHRGIRNDAILKLKHIGWEGVAMMEYRWNPATDEFYFIELNARFWGSLHHALFAGVNFPKLLIEKHLGLKVKKVNCYPLGLKCRYTFPMEVYYTASILKDPCLPVSKKIMTVVEFFLLFFDPNIKSDYWVSRDKKLYFKSIKKTLIDIIQ